MKLKDNPDEIYAMKVIDKAMIAQHKSIAQQSLTERDVLTLLDHPYIVHLYYCFQTESSLVIVMQLVTGGDIYQHLTLDERFDEDRYVSYTKYEPRMGVSNVLTGSDITLRKCYWQWNIYTARA